MARGPQGPGGGPARPVWPFPVKNIAQQSRRTDQGWDLQYPGITPVAVRAVVPGTLQVASPDPGGFGDSYPLLMLDSPVGGAPVIYYGHTFADTSKVGRHVAAGEAIGRTGGAHSGGNAYPDPNWLEIGFWSSGPVGNGTAMKAWLLGASSPPPGPGGGGGGPPGPGGGASLTGVVAFLLAAAGVAVVLLALAAGGAARGVTRAGRPQ